MTKESEDMVKKTIHDFIMPILITIIGALVSVILWFLIQVHNRVDSMYAAVIDQKVRIERIDTEKNELNKNFAEFKSKMIEDVQKTDNDIQQIKLEIGIINTKKNIGDISQK
jgi:cell division protein FtsB